MIFHGGTYFYSESRRRREIWIRKSRSIPGISRDPGVCVWTAPWSGGNADHIWGPELHLLDGKWFIYYAADDGRNENRRMWVLESEGADPCGRYRGRGQLETGGWAIDGTVMTLADGRRYFLWSGRPGRRSRQQNLYIAPMRSPAGLSGSRVLLISPEQSWECVAMPVCEGPQVLRRNGDVFILLFGQRELDPGLLPRTAS